MEDCPNAGEFYPSKASNLNEFVDDFVFSDFSLQPTVSFNSLGHVVTGS